MKCQAVKDCFGCDVYEMGAEYGINIQYPNPSLPYPILWISVCSRRWRTLKELITGWICLPPFHFPLLSFWPPLSPASFFSSLYNSVNISERSSCGVHIRKWLLASPLSPLLIPPHLIRVTSNSLLPLLFSTQLCESLCFPDGGEHVGNWLLARSVSLLFTPLFYPPGRLCLLPPSSLLCITPWTSLRGPVVDCT